MDISRMPLEQLLLLIAALSILFALPSLRKRPQQRKARRERAVGYHRRFPRDKLSGRVIRVIDGDGLIADIAGFGKLNIRLAHIDAPEQGQPWGGESKQELARLLGYANVQFRLLYRDQHARAVAVVWSGNTVINEEMVRLGHAWVYERYVPSSYRPRYQALMEKARQSRSGLWRTGSTPIPPWEWRQKPARSRKRIRSGFLWLIIMLLILFLLPAI